MFLKARDDLSVKGLVFLRASGDDHSSVISALRSHGRMMAGNQLNRLRELRGLADYDTATDVDSIRLDSALNLAQDVRRMLAPDWGLTA